MALPTSPTEQFSMLIVVPVKSGRNGELAELLDTIRVQTKDEMFGNEVPDSLFPFAKIKTIHYSRFVLLDQCPRFGSGYQLVFSTNYDGPEGQICDEVEARRLHLEEVVTHARSTLDRIYDCCVGYPGAGASKDEVLGYLSSSERQVPSQTFYVGSSGRSRSQIFEEAALRQKIETVLDSNYADWKDLSAQDIRQHVKREVGKLNEFPSQPDLDYKVTRLKWVAGILLLLTLPVSVPLLIVGAITLRLKEESDPQFEPVYSQQERDHQDRASLDEDVFLQNALSHVVDVKSGWFRGALIRLVFKALNFLAKNIFNKGTLGGIPSIHFARWVFVDHGKRLLFLSNFDSSWQSYLGDFIDQASSGLTGVWSNSVGYPKTKWLLSSGSRNAARFKAWTRHNQIPTHVWYSAYPGLSVRVINDNTKIRRGLADSNSMSAKWWLSLLSCGPDKAAEAEPRVVEERYPGADLPFERIQGLILRGYGHKSAARFVMMRVEDATKARAWLGGLDLTHAANAPRNANVPDPFINLAFTHQGLEALNLDREILDGFPIDFVQGSDKESRSRILGDIGSNAPANWEWGTGDKSVDVLMMVYASTEKAIGPHFARLQTEAIAGGMRIVQVLDGGELPGRKEHFGFRDGIAQPVVQGAGREERSFNTIAPGEMLLGYPNNYRSIESEGDSNITHSPKNSELDFGVDGSYLVFRQLEQNVNEFWRDSSRFAESGLSKCPVTVASKMVGRWPSGAALVRHPESDPVTDIDDVKEDRFSYLSKGKENDRSGSRCPFGAHIRRSNPRDWELGGNRAESMRLSNLHRIIRRGRPYGEPYVEDMEVSKMIDKAKAGGDDKKRGLHFICFNANIERQFEFAQQVWANASTFAGLATDADAITGSIPKHQVGLGAPTFTIQKEPLRARCPDMQQFVTVKGSSYFFMPSLPAVKYLMQQRA